MTDPRMMVAMTTMAQSESVEITLADPTVSDLLDAFFRFIRASGFEPPKGAVGIDFYYGEGDEAPENDDEVH